jgi:hypothetical protein
MHKHEIKIALERLGGEWVKEVRERKNENVYMK